MGEGHQGFGRKAGVASQSDAAPASLRPVNTSEGNQGFPPRPPFLKKLILAHKESLAE